MVTAKKLWLKSWPKGIPQHIDYPMIPLYEILRKTAKEHPEKTATAYLGNTMTYSELDNFSDQFASALAALSVEKGDRVALYLPNIPQFVIAYFGILKAGAIVTAISPLLKEREVEHQLNDSAAETVVAIDSLQPILREVWQETQLKKVILTSTREYECGTTFKTDKFDEQPNTYSFQKLLKENQTKTLKKSIDPETDLAALQYTGGTTGTAKGAMLTHMNMVSNAMMFADWIKGEEAKETFLTALPLFHIYGMTTSMNVPIHLAAEMVLIPSFNPTSVLAAIQDHKVTIFCGVPTMYTALLASSELTKFNLTSLRVCISGASPLSPKIQEKFMKLTSSILTEGYGLTEASPVTHCNPIDETPRPTKVGSIGVPLPDTDSRIVALETGKEINKPGEIGELVVKGPQVMKGYWRKPEETEAVLHHGWLQTGDIGKMDEDGYFYITDRKKDLIKYKDYSVYPHEIENMLLEHPGVKLSAVIGRPDPMAGEIPKAFVVLKKDARATPEEIMAFVNTRIAPYKAIREVEIRENLPLSSIGKVLKRALQEEEKKTRQT
jgi:long-chain acyl-CoA synthetase